MTYNSSTRFFRLESWLTRPVRLIIVLEYFTYSNSKRHMVLVRKLIYLLHAKTLAWFEKINTDLLSNRRLRNCYFSVILKNTHQLHFFRRKVQLVAAALFFKLRLHFSEWLRNNYFSGDWHIDKPKLIYLHAFRSVYMTDPWKCVKRVSTKKTSIIC
jgi:hypothetical protein